MDKQKITIIILGVALFLVIQYMIIDDWTRANQQLSNEMYQQGYEQGLIDAISAVFQQTQDCQISNITFKNFTKQIFDIGCLESNSEILQPWYY